MTDEEESMETTTDLAIRRSIHVKATPERAFEVFAAGIGNWWPLETHSIGAMHGAPPQELHLELREGGRFYERTADGEERSWGRVLTCDRPRRIVLEWHVNPANPATEIDVAFTPEDGGTRVELAHRGWERFADPTETRASYVGENGWTTVLGLYAAAASA
jgi:uncharacterized protein YndB with AHSA1/START domain